VNDQELEMIFDMMGTKLSRLGLNKSAKCPLAPWTHRKGVDKSPSCTAKAGEPALFKCWSCQEQGSVRKLARLYGVHSGDQRPYQFVCEVEGERPQFLDMPINAAKRGYGSSSKRYGTKIKEELAKEITEETIQKFCEEIPQYAYDRGMSRAQIDRWEIGFDPQEKRMTFPIRDHIGKLFGVSGRDLTNLVKNKYKHYYGLKKEKLFYGERHVDRSHKTVHIVEGFFDVFGLERHGFKNVFASMGTSLSMIQMKKIKDWFDEVIFFPDGDQPGLKFAEEQALSIFIQQGKRVGIAGVKLNPHYIKRDKLSGRWQDSDHRFQLLEQLVGKDPSDWTKSEIKLALSNLGYFELGHGGVRCDVEDWTKQRFNNESSMQSIIGGW